MAVENLPPEVEDALLKVALGLVIALVASILYNLNERVVFLEQNRTTPDGIKNAMREVLGERKR